MTAPVRAPELSGHGGWIGTERPVRLSSLRGKVVVLHFWRFGSVNCHRLLERLRRLEDRFADELAVVGVHSPKFACEADHQAVVAGVTRHHIGHPVLDDPDLATWERYGVEDWPTAVLVDPEGRVVERLSGRDIGKALEQAVADLVAEREETGRPTVGPTAVRPLLPPPATLAFPGKVAVSADGQRLAIADTGHDQVMLCWMDGLVLEVHTGFSQPQGVRFDGDHLLVCDTGGSRVVRTTGEVVADDLSSPWDLVADRDGSWVVAEAGRNRLRRQRPGEHQSRLAAGTGEEGLVDGPATQALLAQPAGVSRTREGIVFTDAETSALRILDERGRVTTLVGRGPWEWGSADGAPEVARLQHPTGVAAGPEGQVYVADTGNSLLRAWDGSTLRSLPVQGLDQPEGLDVLPDGRLVVADTNHHRVVVVDPWTGALDALDLDESWAVSASGPPLSAAAGRPFAVPVTLHLAGEELDDTAGPAVQVAVQARPESLVRGGPQLVSLHPPQRAVSAAAGAPGHGLLLVEVRARTRQGRCRTTRVWRRRHPFEVA